MKRKTTGNIADTARATTGTLATGRPEKKFARDFLRHYHRHAVERYKAIATG